eukprot:TRINITY_DN6805_c1_g1_i6.p1 TRINITY_DN6805_c1_g1~~TRINITY_DN6805_c1_g1_i6.p1  ORF type:complete len:467 (+),score=96.57 TRINITY_DN6805_c1_g1_i6:764-2164(+)
MQLEALLMAEKHVRSPPVMAIHEVQTMDGWCGVQMQDMPRALEVLHQIGSIVYFRNPRNGDNLAPKPLVTTDSAENVIDFSEGESDCIVVLDPQWLARVLASVVNSKQQDGAHVTEFGLEQMWRVSGIPKMLHSTLLFCRNLKSSFPCLHLIFRSPPPRPRLLGCHHLAPSPPFQHRTPPLHPPSHRRSRLALSLLFRHPRHRRAPEQVVPDQAPGALLLRLMQERRRPRAAPPDIIILASHARHHDLQPHWPELDQGGGPMAQGAHSTTPSSPCRPSQCPCHPRSSLHTWHASVLLRWGMPRWCERARQAGTLMPTMHDLVPDLVLSDLDEFAVSFNELELEERIGGGGFGIVYKGKMRGQVVAIKQINVEMHQRAEDVFREFCREVWLSSTLQHKSLVTLKAFCLAPFCIVMDPAHQDGPQHHGRPALHARLLAQDMPQGPEEPKHHDDRLPQPITKVCQREGL